MRLILEGPDNAGKTTLADLIFAKCPHVVYKHAGGPPKSWHDEEACMKEQEGWLCLEHVIVDRVTAISQRVYNPDTSADQIRLNRLNAMLSKFRPIVVYCRPSTDRLMRFEKFTWRNGETEEHKQKILDNQHTFIERYDAIMANVPHVLYDFDDADVWTLIYKLFEGLNGDMAAYNWLMRLAKAGRA